jgi:flagellar biosynthesis anti-sigma factor FlgM
MRIDDVYKMGMMSSSAETSNSRRSDSREENVTELQNPEKSGTKVDLSSTSVEFSRAAEMIDQESTERMERVNQIRELIGKGEYEVNSSRIADGILKESLFDFLKS